MSRLRILHTTSYQYAEPVHFGLHRLVIRPREGHDVQVEELALTVEPASTITWHRDLFGNSVAHVFFSEPSDRLVICNNVVVNRREHASSEERLHGVQVRMPMVYSPVETSVAQGYLAPVYPEEAPRLTIWGAGQFRPAAGTDAVALMRSVNRWIFENIRYRRREDRGVQTPLQTLDLASGSCRDMATLMLELSRTFGLASRFASGYLDSIASAAGRAATHAWMEMYFPEHGWFGYDPTLGEGTSLKHIVMGVSSHPRGVMPVGGVFSGPAGSYLGMEVSVRIEKLS